MLFFFFLTKRFNVFAGKTELSYGLSYGLSYSCLMEFLQAGGKPVPKTLGQYVNVGKVRLAEEHGTWRTAA